MAMFIADPRAIRKRPQPPPRLWLVSDARNDPVLADAIAKLPPGSALLYRHYHLDPEARAARLRSLLPLIRRRRVQLFIADPQLWRMVRPHPGRHCNRHQRARPVGGALPTAVSASVHIAQEWQHARQIRANILLLSPIFVSRSHPGGRCMSRALARMIIAKSRVPVILLGGMTRTRFAMLKNWRAFGWAAIDGLSGF
jgi:thiamine-phosphate pyrophosphorylase